MATRKQVYYEWVSRPNGTKTNICKIVLNSTSGVHSLSPAIVSGLQSIFDELENNEECKGYILTANSSKRRAKKKKIIFSAGLDLKIMNDKRKGVVVNYLLSINKLWIRTHELRKPIMAMVNGDAIAGGCMLACNCDYRVAFKSAKFHMVETKIGLTIQPSTYECIQRVIGNHHKTSWFLQTALPVNGAQAMHIGIVDKFVEPHGDENELLKTCVDIMEKEYFNADINCATSPRRLGRLKVLQLLKEEQDPRFGERDSMQYVGLKGMKQSKL